MNFINPQFTQTLKLCFAQVIDVDTDAEKQANAVKIKILGAHDEWDDDHLPWCYPLNQFYGSTENSGEVRMPLVDSFIWVTKLLNKWFYVFNGNQVTSNLASKYFDDIQDELGELDQITAPDLEYPDCVSFFYESGLCVTYSTDSEKPIYSVYHPEGSYCIIDTDGNIGTYSVANIEMMTESGVHFYTDDENTYFEDGNENKISTTDDGIEIEDKNSNKWTSTDEGIETEDTNGNKITTDSNGMILEDISGNTTTMSNTGIKHEDLNGNIIEMKAGMIDVNNGNLQTLQ